MDESMIKKKEENNSCYGSFFARSIPLSINHNRNHKLVPTKQYIYIYIPLAGIARMLLHSNGKWES